MTTEFLARGRRLTPRRRLVYETLVATRSHPDAHELIAMVRRADPGISVATVYNTLRVLVDAGRALELRGLGPRTRYDANVDAHDHFTCRTCGAVHDIPPQHAIPWRLRGAGLGRHRVEDMTSVLRGECGLCRAMARSTASHPARPTSRA